MSDPNRFSHTRVYLDYLVPSPWPLGVFINVYAPQGVYPRPGFMTGGLYSSEPMHTVRIQIFRKRNRSCLVFPSQKESDETLCTRKG